MRLSPHATDTCRLKSKQEKLMQIFWMLVLPQRLKGRDWALRSLKHSCSQSLWLLFVIQFDLGMLADFVPDSQ